jgi:hypothetical protein
MFQIFISYRRDDVPGVAGRLGDRLVQEFSRKAIFIDVDAMKPGGDFLTQIEKELAKCDVLLAVIGPNWMNPVNDRGLSRIGQTGDYVRIELAAALKRGISVIPVLVDSASMPSEDALPEDLKPLCRRSGMVLRNTRFDADSEAILRALKSILPRRSKWRQLVVAGLGAAVILSGFGWISTQTEFRLPAWFFARVPSTPKSSSDTSVSGTASEHQVAATDSASAEPATEQLKAYITALQTEKTDAATKERVLRKILSLDDSQNQALLALSPSADCGDEKLYDDPKYSEPIALTLIDLARSSDHQTSTLAQQAIDKLKAKSLFADAILKGRPECRSRWILRLEVAEARALSDILKSKGLPSAELEALDLRTPDNWRTIIKPTPTSEGDLYRVIAKIPSDDGKLKCLASVYRLVNVQDEAASANVADPLRKEFELLKAMANQPRTVGWYNKIFQRDLLVGAHQCNVEAVATH